MFVTIINDCKDANAVARQETRASALLKSHVIFVGVKNDIEAAGNIIDVLDAAGDEKGVILVNVAPRNGKAKKWENGTPFGYFRYKNVLVVSSIDGKTLSLVKRLGLVTEIELLDIPTVLESLCSEGSIDSLLKDHITLTQFRSYEFVPRVAAWILEGKKIPSNTLSLVEIEDCGDVVWWVDNFGNAKTTIVASEFGAKDGKHIQTLFGEYAYYEHLKDVPDGDSAIIAGSSGIGGARFLEVVVQGKSAKQRFDISTGNPIFN